MEVHSAAASGGEVGSAWGTAFLLEAFLEPPDNLEMGTGRLDSESSLLPKDFASSRKQETADSFCDRPHKFSSVAIERRPFAVFLVYRADANSPTAARNCGFANSLGFKAL